MSYVLTLIGRKLVLSYLTVYMQQFINPILSQSKTKLVSFCYIAGAQSLLNLASSVNRKIRWDETWKIYI